MSEPFHHQLAELLRSRRTIHLFQPVSPPAEAVRRAVDLARWAPNHHHTEPWRFTLLGPETAARIVELNAELVAAKKGPEAGAAKRRSWSEVPGWLLVTCDRSDDPQRQEEDYAACCCAVQNLSLSLWSEGIGVKWTTGDVTRDPRFFEIAGIDPSRQKLVGLLWYGYPQQVPAQSRRPVDDILQTRP